MKRISLAIVFALVLSAGGIAVLSGGATAEEAEYLNGSGTKSDPFLVSSADDLRMISEYHFLYPGAHYRQTQDIVFDDAYAEGHRITFAVSVTEENVIFTIATDMDGVPRDVFAAVSFNTYFQPAVWQQGFRDVSFPIEYLEGNNSAVIAGHVDGEYFAAALSFTDKDKGASVSAPFKGNFVPIGSWDKQFTGTYDGGGHSIEGIKAVSASAAGLQGAAALFGHAASSVFYNISIGSEHSDTYMIAAGIVLSQSSSPYLYAGGIVGIGNDVSIVACSVNAVISSFMAHGIFLSTAATFRAELRTGGIMGSGDGMISGCTAAGIVHSSVFYQMGGPPYDSPSSIRISTYAGGIVGQTDQTTIKSTGNAASVRYAFDLFPVSTGGAVPPGSHAGLNIESAAGGIAGDAGRALITDTYNRGNVTGHSCRFIELGLNSFPACHITEYAGGCAGIGAAGITNFYNSGLITISKLPYGAGSGEDPMMVLSAAAAETTLGTHADAGAPKAAAGIYALDGSIPAGDLGDPLITAISEAQAADHNTFEGWDFDRIWTIADGMPAIWVRYDLRIFDETGTFDGTERYSLDRRYSFDEDGTAHSFAGKDGFSMTLEDDYRDSDVTLYTVSDDEVIILEKDGNSNYMIPSVSLLEAALGSSDTIVLHADGFEAIAITWPDIDAATLVKALAVGAAVLMLLIIAVMAAITAYNAMNTRSILAECAGTGTKGRKVRKDEQA